MTLAVTTIDEIPTTDQELVDFVFTKLNTQKNLGYDRNTGACQYRTFPTGDREDVAYRTDMECCAIGLLIPDDVAQTIYRNIHAACMVNGLLEGVEIRLPQLPDDDDTAALRAWYKRMAPFDDGFLIAIQNVHDETAMAKMGRRIDTFHDQLAVLENDYGIDVDAIRDLDWSWLETYDVPED